MISVVVEILSTLVGGNDDEGVCELKNGNHLLVTEKLLIKLCLVGFHTLLNRLVELLRTVFNCGSVLLFVLTALTSAAVRESSVTAASIVSSSHTKRYVDIWSKAAIGRMLFCCKIMLSYRTLVTSVVHF